MSRLHDMGGRFGDGSIPIPRDGKNEVTNIEPTFKYEWHAKAWAITCLLYTSPSPRDRTRSRMPSSA